MDHVRGGSRPSAHQALRQGPPRWRRGRYSRVQRQRSADSYSRTGSPNSFEQLNTSRRPSPLSKTTTIGWLCRCLDALGADTRNGSVHAIERQLAHTPRDKVRAAYNYAEHPPERRRMMQGWADYLDDLRDAARARNSKRTKPEPLSPLLMMPLRRHPWTHGAVSNSDPEAP